MAAENIVQSISQPHPEHSGEEITWKARLNWSLWFDSIGTIQLSELADRLDLANLSVCGSKPNAH